MQLSMLKAKLHRLTVTASELDYEGSITIDSRLLAAAGILEYEAVHVWNVTRGTRFETYAIRGPAGSGVVCVNGAAAHLVEPGNIVIVAAFALLDEQRAREHRPKILLIGENNTLPA